MAQQALPALHFIAANSEGIVVRSIVRYTLTLILALAGPILLTMHRTARTADTPQKNDELVRIDTGLVSGAPCRR